MCQRILLCIFFIAVWTISLLANEVISTGTAEIFNGNVNNANQQALQNALRQALRQTVADLIDSKTLAQNFQVLNDEIFSSSRSFVTNFQILKEGRTADNTAFQIEIRAWIANKVIHEKLTALRILHKKISRKRLMLIYHKQDPQALTRHFPAVSRYKDVLHDVFHQERFQIVNEREMDPIYQTIEGAGVINRPIESLFFLALDQQADILVSTELVTSKLGHQNGSFKTIQADVHLSIYDVSTGRQIAEVLGSGKKLSTGISAADKDGIFKIIAATAARQAAKVALDKIRDYYQTIGDQGFVYLMVFRNYNQDEVNKILDYLESVPAFKDLSELKNTPNHLEIEMISSESKSRLQRKIQWELQPKKIEMDSHQSTGNRLLFIKPKTESN